MSARPLREEIARLRSHAERVPVLGQLTRSAYALVCRHPALHRTVRPLAAFAVDWLKPPVRDLYVGARHATTMARGWLGLPAAASRFLLAWHSSNRAGVGNRPVGRQVVMLAVSDMRIDPRVEREARALAAAGYTVHVIWTDPLMRRRGGPQPSIDWGQGITFEAIPERDGRFSTQFPGFLGSGMLKAALAHRPFAFHGHDLDTALVALTAARQTGAHAVCDYHEWYSENVTWAPLARVYRPHSQLRKQGYRRLEALSFAHASALVTVCDSIAEAMAEEVGDGRMRPAVIRNIPTRIGAPSRSYPPLKQQFGLPEDRFVLLWQGGIGPSRLIEPIIQALAHAPECTFVIRGPEMEAYGPGYAAIAAGIGASDRLILAPAVPSRDVVEAACGADAGIWTLPELCRNFTYALPNKIFEYLASGLPVLGAHHPEARRLIEGHKVGLCFDPYDPKSIATAINRLIAERALREGFAANAGVALARLDADAEWRKLVTLYDALPRDLAERGPKPLDAPSAAG
jgi:starch synthase